MEFIRQRLLKVVYTSVSQTVLKTDKLAVATHIAKEMYPGIFQPNVIRYFINEISLNTGCISLV